MSDSYEKIKNIINEINFTMMATMSEDGKHRSRPMTTIEVSDFSDGIWFLGDNTSDAVADIKANDQICLSYAAPDSGDYVSVTGIAKLVDDRAKLDELWSPSFNAFYSGKDDPKLQLIKVIPEYAGFWSGANSVKSFYEMAKATLTGEKAEDLGESGEVDFKFI